MEGRTYDPQRNTVCGRKEKEENSSEKLIRRPGVEAHPLRAEATGRWDRRILMQGGKTRGRYMIKKNGVGRDTTEIMKGRENGNHAKGWRENMQRKL